MLEMPSVKLRWWHLKAFLIQISFKFRFSAAPTRHLTVVPKCYGTNTPVVARRE
jgi:hypothetical protein